MNGKTRKLIASFMAASMLTMAGCSSDVAQQDEEDNEPGIVTSSWDNDQQQWHHYRTYRGSDYYFGSSTTPHPSTVYTPGSTIAKSVEPVSVQKMSAGGFTGGVRSTVSAAKGGIGGGGGRAGGVGGGS